MEKRTIYISSFDRKRLMKLIKNSPKFNNPGKNYVRELGKELDRGEIIEPKDMPKDVITMNSMVRLKDLDIGEEMRYTLVFPDMAEISKNKISILAPIGTALLGYRVGDIIEWKVPTGLRKLQVEEILYQPEAAGDFHL